MYTNKQIWSVSYPIFLGLLAQNIINVTSTAFLGRVGEVELGASALGGLFYICMFTLAFGYSTGSQIMLSRRNGEQDYKSIGPIVIQGILFLMGLALVVFALTKFFAPSIMRFMISSEEIRQKTVDFLDWRVYGFFFSFVNVMFRAFFVGITRTKVLTVNAIVMAVTNFVFDYLLIFGHFGFPKMGIEGAAIAAVIAEGSSILFFVIYTYYTVDLKKYGLDRFTNFDMDLLKRNLNISFSMMVQYFLSLITWFIFFIAVERLGETELAIANIIRSIYAVLMIPVGALCTTVNSFVSNTIGRGAYREVLPLIKRVSKHSFVLMLFFALITTLFPHAILSIYTNNPLLIEGAINSVYAITIAMLLSSIGSVFFSGVSGTGNTQTALGFELITLVFYIAFVYIAAVKLRLPVELCFSVEILYYGLLFILSALYLKKGNWQKKRI